MPSIRISIREARASDMPEMQELLTQVHLSTTDLLVEGTCYWLAEDEQGKPVGVVGLEIGENAVLLRSAGVSPALQGQGIGTRLLAEVLSAAATRGYSHVYLFSTDAGSYWQRQGFREVPVPELVGQLSAAPQVKEYERLGWLPTEVAWRYDLAQPGRGY